MKINNIQANKSSFHDTTFNESLSVVLADVTEESTDKDSRNGLGKTLLVEIINFCLGSSVSDSLDKPELKSWAFMLDVEISGANFTFKRSLDNSNTVTISGDLDNWPIKTDEDSLTIKVDDFKRILGVKVFGVSREDDKPNQLSYRNLMSYFMRTDATAFVDPFKYFAGQKATTVQMANAYLLGLNDDYSYSFYKIEKKKKLLADLEKAATSGMLDDFTGNMGELEAQRVRLQQKLDSLKERVAAFRVHDVNLPL